MVQDKNKTNLTKTLKSLIYLILPSFFGLSCYLIFFIIFIAVSIPSSYKDTLKTINLNLFKGTVIESIFNGLLKIINTHTFNLIIDYIFWIFIAFIVVSVAYRISKNVGELGDDISIRNYIWPKNKDVDVNKPLRDLIEKIAFHFVLICLLIFFIVKFTPKLIHYSSNFDAHFTLSSHFLMLFLKAFIYIFLYFHVLVILTRMLLARKRIYK